MTVQDASRSMLVLGCGLAGFSVAAGAFGAHMLKGSLEVPMLAAYDTATRYQMYHAFGMILVGITIRASDNPRLIMAGWLFLAGTLLFSGSLYGIALGGVKWLGPATPVGGLAFIIGWALFGWRAWRGVSAADKVG